MKIYLVGGAIRDKLLGLPQKERDWVVVGATIEDMLSLGYRQVGKEFPVFLHPKTGEEYALARMERKTNPGYKGFSFDTSSNVTLENDLLRRDLTINAMACDPETDKIIDPFGGRIDIQKKILRAISPAFAEDPVRILRVGRFFARFAYLGFTVDPETIQLMQRMVQAGEVNALVAERVWKEVERALGEKNPEKFFELLGECQALPILFPHINLEGTGIKALLMAANLTQDTSIRFAALLHVLHKNEIASLCNRYRVPNAYRELALLTATHYAEVLEKKNLSADKLLELFSRLDIFRRDLRFRKFLIVCEAIANARQCSFDPQWLIDCAKATKSVNIQTLISQGLEGNELAAKLKEKRREKIEQWLNSGCREIKK